MVLFLYPTIIQVQKVANMYKHTFHEYMSSFLSFYLFFYFLGRGGGNTLYLFMLYCCKIYCTFLSFFKQFKLCRRDYKKQVKMQNPPSKFHHFSFQSSKFRFCHFSSLSFIHFQLSPQLTIHQLLPLSHTDNTVFSLYLIFN